MDAARMVVCPSCGASVAEGARRCAHCDAAIATVRCGRCFHMSARDAAFCAACGRELGLEPVARDGEPLDCPDCHVPMAPLDCGRGALYDCGRCGGQFVEHAALRDLFERHDELPVPSRRAPAAARVDTRVRYVACPSCHELMNRRNFGAGSGVIVDVCSRHGTWFDAGELPRVLAYVENGGLERARRAAGDERARLEHARKQERISAIAVPSDAPHEANALAQAAVDLLSFLLGS